MLQQKIFKLLAISIFFCAIGYKPTVFADTCPDMSSTSTIPSGWTLTEGEPQPLGNIFDGAVWADINSHRVIHCVYNSYPTSTFVLMRNQNATPFVPGSNWLTIGNMFCDPQTNQFCRCDSNVYPACPFDNSLNNKK